MATKLVLLAVLAVYASALGLTKPSSAIGESDLEEEGADETDLEQAALQDAEAEINGVKDDSTTAVELAAAAAPVAPPKAEAKPVEKIPVAAAPVKKAEEPKKNLRSAVAEAPKDDVVKTLISAIRSTNTKSSQPIENAVTDLMMQKMAASTAAFAATPFGDSVNNILDLIKDTIMANLKKEYEADQVEINALADEVTQCDNSRKTNIAIADESKDKYHNFAPLHVNCREGEAGKKVEQTDCWAEHAAKVTEQKELCDKFAVVTADYDDEESKKLIMERRPKESTESYVKRIQATVCPGGGDEEGTCKKCGDPGCGFEYSFMCHKEQCDTATTELAALLERCTRIDSETADKIVECDNIQDQMDNNACKRAVDMKDACEKYESCYDEKKKAFDDVEAAMKHTEHGRHEEWIGLEKITCFLEKMHDGKIEKTEIALCQEMSYNADEITIEYPVLTAYVDCLIPPDYPVTADYKIAQFAILPALAKGKEGANECAGIMEIPTVPLLGSPEGCKCERLTMNGPYSAGPIVKCEGCTDVRKSTDESSCPDGTKIFSPRSRSDWKTFMASADPLGAPDFVVDITRPEDGCGGCVGSAMNSGEEFQSSWVTSDGSAWWLRSESHPDQPSSDYQANCFFNLGTSPFASEDAVSFHAKACDYHSTSYYCQLREVSLTPKEGSPEGCLCEKVALTAAYSARVLIQCKACLDVSKSTDKNSCPAGTKLFSPASKNDWKVIVDSVQPLRFPNWIVDVTRPVDGCGGCSAEAMNSDNAGQKTWQTADGSPWYLRNSRYSAPNSDYKANCYMDLYKTPENEDSVHFTTSGCDFHSNTYYCQPALTKKKEVAVSDGPPVIGGWTYSEGSTCEGSTFQPYTEELGGEPTEGVRLYKEDCAKADGIFVSGWQYVPKDAPAVRMKFYIQQEGDAWSSPLMVTIGDGARNKLHKTCYNRKSDWPGDCDEKKDVSLDTWHEFEFDTSKLESPPDLLTVTITNYADGRESAIVVKDLVFTPKPVEVSKDPDIDGGGWTLVRHVPAGSKWHPATDQLTGSSSYGDPTKGKDATEAWSMKFDDVVYNQFLFASGDETKWLIATKDTVIGGWYNNQDRDILKSSEHDGPYQAKWYRREGSLEDPWVSLSDHGSAIAANELVYGENNFASGSHVAVLSAHGGANVFVREKKEEEKKED